MEQSPFVASILRKSETQVTAPTYFLLAHNERLNQISEKTVSICGIIQADDT